jgi:cardiolipin synthase
MPDAGGEDRILTVPNAITAVRLACIPLFVVLIARPHRADWITAAYLLGGLGATDWIDGFLARRLGQVSALGKVLDPLADRLLLVTAAVSTILVGAIPAAVAVIALLREGTVVVGFVIVAAAGGRRMDVTRAGKAATLGLMIALPLVLAGHSTIGWHETAEVLAWVFVVPGLVAGWYSVVAYIPMARRAIDEGRPAAGRGTPM